MKLQVEENCGGIEGLKLVTPQVFGDSRGWFMEAYNEREFAEIGITEHFVQDNQSFSARGVLRGLHFQKEHAQAKLVRVISGEVYDVAVDIRRGSPTWGRFFGVRLTAENRKQFYIPKNFAHGFLVLSETAEFAYKCTDFYHPEDEGGILYNDPGIGIDWPLAGIEELKLSDRDTRWSGIGSLTETGT